jgi:hypothetical protein
MKLAFFKTSRKGGIDDGIVTDWELITTINLAEKTTEQHPLGRLKRRKRTAIVVSL